jgi:hypothetical protein
VVKTPAKIRAQVWCQGIPLAGGPIFDITFPMLSVGKRGQRLLVLFCFRAGLKPRASLFSCHGATAGHRTGCTPRGPKLRLGKSVNLVWEKAPFPVGFPARRLTYHE